MCTILSIVIVIAAVVFVLMKRFGSCGCCKEQKEKENADDKKN